MDSFEAAEEIPANNAYKLLFRAAMAVPTWHYWVALVIVCMVFLYNFLEFHFLADLFSGFRGNPVLLVYNSSSQLYQEVASKCGTLHGRYLATPWLSSPHLQTIFIAFFGWLPAFNYRRQLFQTFDGGTLALDWLMHSDVSQDDTCQKFTVSKDDTVPILIVIPGLSSDSAAPYIKHLALATAKRGWNVVICNHRGLGGISVTSDCFYNAGWTEDIREIVNHLHQKYPDAPLFVVGTSIGANILVKYLGEEGDNVAVAGAATICSPWDLLISSRFISRRLIQKLYDRALTFALQEYAQVHQHHYSRLADWEGIKKSSSIRDFDTYATCLVGNYETVDTYYRRCSSSPFVGHVSVPLLCIGALDDPLCTTESVPWDECRLNKNIILAMTKHGGHLAFFEGKAASSLWWVKAVNEFFEVLHTSPCLHRKKPQTPTHHPAVIKSSVVQGPYVVSVADGMVAEVSTEPKEDDTIKESSEDERFHDHVMDEEQSSKQSATTIDTGKENGNALEPPTTRAIQSCFSQISQYNKRSMWLLAYIAILSSWPMLDTALKFFFKKKLKKV